MNSFQKASSALRYSVRKSFRCRPEHQLKHSRQLSTPAEAVPESSNSDEIVIPKRIPRQPTDILKALSSTVARDFTAPHYKYHDDPFLIPTSNMAKRAFAMSQESGRKAAHWIKQEHSHLFQHKVADPPIEVYFPKAVFDENSEVDETILQKVMSQHLVSDALTIYGLLEQKGVELSRATKQSLLELVCYYNGQDTLDESWIEERWFSLSQKSREKKTSSWKRGGVAEKLFANLNPPDSASFAALICGKAQFGDADGAYKLYQEAMDARIGLPVQAFNSIISGSNILKEGHDLRWQIVEEIMSTMKQQGVVPDLGTLNAILATIDSMSSSKDSQKHALQIMAEFRAMGIEPSLTSYYFLMTIFCRNRTKVRSAILVNILNVLEGKLLEIRDPRDVMFFCEAMDICRFYLSDIDLAYRLDKLLYTGDNYNLIGDSYKESLYYRNFFSLLCQMGTFKEFMDIYNKLVPNIYVPEPAIMEEIINIVDLNEEWGMIPQLWSNLIMFELWDRETLLRALLSTLQRCTSSDTDLRSRLADVAWAIWQRVEGQTLKGDRAKNKIEWTGQMLGEIVEVLLRADRYSDSLEIMNCLDSRQQQILGVPSLNSLEAFLDESIKRKETKNAIWCLQYCSDAGFEETVKLAQKLNEALSLSETEQALVVNIVGQDALKNKLHPAVEK